MLDPDSTDNDLARWLQEAGRRRVTTPPPPLEPAAEAPVVARKPKRPHILHPRELILLLFAALAFMPYFFADVQVQIYSLRSLIAFVFPDSRP